MNGGSDSMCRLGQFPTAGDNAQFRTWANSLIVAIGSYYLVYGSYLMLSGAAA